MKRASTNPIHGPARRDRARRGVTLLEVMLAGAIGLVIAGAAMGVLHSGQATFSRSTIESSLQVEATRILETLASEFVPCGASTASLAPADAKGGPYFTAQPCTGDNGAAIVYGDPLTVHCERPADAAGAAAQPAPAAEPSATGGGGSLKVSLGAGDSSLLAQIPTGNLLSTPTSPVSPPPAPQGEASASASSAGDDWTLVLTIGGKRHVLGGNVAPNGLLIALDGQLVTLQLELERPMPNAAPVRVSATRKIRLAN